MINSVPTPVKVQWWVRRAIEDHDSALFACTAGLGSGKTHGGLQWLYNCVARDAGPFFGYMMPLYELIFNTAIPITEKVLQQCGLESGRDYTIVKSPYPKCVFRGSGQEIHYLSGNRPDKVKAVEYADALMDEPGVTPFEAFKRLRERVRGNGLNQLMLHGTPEGINWYADEFDSEKNAGWNTTVARDHILIRREVIAGEEYETRLRRFRLTTFDNKPHLPPGYIPQIFDTHRGNPAYIQAYVYGHFVPLITGNCYSNYCPQKHDLLDVEADPALEIALTWDYNAEPLAWVANQRMRFNEPDRRTQKWVAVHEANMGAGQIDDACIEFAAKCPPEQFSRTPIKLYGDMSGHAKSHKTRHTDYQQVRRYLRELGYQDVEICALRHNPLETVSVGALNRWFLENELLICKRCTMLRRSLAATRWREGVRKIEKKAGETHTHHGDAQKYFAYAQQVAAGRVVDSFS